MKQNSNLCVAVYCASAPGVSAEYRAEAIALGRCLAEAKFSVVYGGARVGLMGAVADAALEAGGEVYGVLPHMLASVEVAHSGLTHLRLTDTMHERKAAMLEMSHAVIALPGGFGTLDEWMEALTWAQLGIHRMPCILINVAGYYDALLSFLDRAVAEGFLRPANRDLVLVAANAPQAVAMLKAALA